MAQVHAGLAKHGMAWFARDQEAGKGQLGRQWQSEPGKNIALSVVLQPGVFKPLSGFYLSVVAALACYDLFSGYAGSETTIKWPNDIYWRDRKAGGLLIENVHQGTAWKYAVIGVGININQTTFSKALKNPVSLKQITGKDQDVEKLGEELYELLMKRVSTIETTSFEEILNLYNHHLFGRNKTVRLKKDNAVFETVIKGVNAKGQLVTVDAIERCFDFGKVKWIV